MKRKTGKRTRIRWTVLLLLSICLTLGACSAKKADTEASPRDTAKYAMEALKHGQLCEHGKKLAWHSCQQGIPGF